ncbi:MAG: OadG family protein [Firmicutes bacterium]|nr:OadG family protein [Bacillota bacterium]
MSLMEQFSDPSLITNLTFGEKMLASTITMIMGLGITFTILILIWIFIAIMGKCMDIASKPKTKAAEPAPAAAVAESAPVEAAAETSDESLVAVIAAAIAAYEGANASNLVVRKITRLSGDQTPWGNFALEDRLETRKF